MTTKRLRGFDLRQIDGWFGLVGVDEAGRGALAGPVVAGAVLANEEFLRSDWRILMMKMASSNTS